jgi:hypothetical protein
MTLTFNIDDLRNLIEFEKKHMETGEPVNVRMVGDEGVYFMPKRFRRAGETARSPIVYAEECNPNTMEFEDWWQNKRSSWGSDDGGTNVPIRALSHVIDNPKAEALSVTFLEDKIEFFAFDKQ